jgi:hypothetical protein
MVEQMEDRVSGEVDSMKGEMAIVRYDVAKALQAVATRLETEGSNHSGPAMESVELNGKIQHMQSSVDVLHEGFQNVCMAANVRSCSLLTARH